MSWAVFGLSLLSAVLGGIAVFVTIVLTATLEAKLLKQGLILWIYGAAVLITLVAVIAGNGGKWLR